MPYQKPLVLFLLLLSLPPAYGINRWLRARIDPKRSGGRFLLYLAACLLFVFVYTYLVSLLIFRLVPPVVPPAR
jgi:hypothetical protein